MPKKSKGRVVFRIDVSAEAVDVITDIKAKLGMTEIAICSKLVNWISEQPDAIKLQILGIFPKLVTEDVTTLVLKRMSDDTTSA